jgi:ABC-2 type transport system ATP-binding protein
VSTHLIDEVSRLMEHILLIDQGKLIIDEEAEALRGRAFAVVGPAAKVDAFTANQDTHAGTLALFSAILLVAFIAALQLHV